MLKFNRLGGRLHDIGLRGKYSTIYYYPRVGEKKKMKKQKQGREKAENSRAFDTK